MSGHAMEMRPGYFRFSKNMVGGIERLEFWWQYFLKKEKPIFIFKSRVPCGHTLWVKGVDAHEKAYSVKDDNLEGDIVREWPKGGRH